MTVFGELGSNSGFFRAKAMTQPHQNKPTIFLSLANFSNISNILRGKTIRYLVEKFRVVVLTEYIDEEVSRRDNYFQHPSIIYKKLPISYRKTLAFFDRFLRIPFLRGYDDLLVTRHWYYRDTHPRRMRWLIKLGAVLPKSFPNAAFFTFWERLAIKPTAEFRKLARRYQPVLLALATPGYIYATFDAEMVLFAKALGLPTAAIDISFDNPTSQGKFIRKTDYLFVWSERMKRATEIFHGYTSKEIFIAGCLKFDHYFNDVREGLVRSREEFLRSKNLDPGKKLVVYATPTEATYPPRREFVETLLGLRRQGKIDGDPNILIRLHPIDSWGPYRDFVGTPGVHIERAGEQRVPDSIKGQRVEMIEKDQLNLTETVKYADVFINFASTMIMEACIFNTPSISIGFPKQYEPATVYEDTVDLMRLCEEPVATSPEELALLINKYLAHPELDRAKYEKVVREFIYFTDGQAWRRTVDFIDHIVKSDPRCQRLLFAREADV